MIPAFVLQLLFTFGATKTAVEAGSPFNNPPGVDIWCGKAYRATNSSFDPGGQLTEPKANSNLLYHELRIYPRKSVYLASDKTATFIVDSVLGPTHGSPWHNYTVSNSARIPFTDLRVQISFSHGTQKDEPIPSIVMPLNTTGWEVEINLDRFAPSLTEEYAVQGLGTDEGALWNYGASPSSFKVLPDRNDTGSVARIDQVGGGLEVKSPITNNTWKQVFPYSYYTSWDWISSTIDNATATKNLTTFRQLGYNIIHPVPPGGDDPFNHTVLEEFLKICDELELYVMYDLRHTYQNNTSINLQLSLLQAHPSLLLYYTADEPDGWGDPLNATRLSYEHIKSVDPYHPVSLVLNCQNFYFKDYTEAATDVILEDTYPVAANTSYSVVYNTPCNATYGDCGCDNCHAGDPAYLAYVKNRFLDIIDRTETLYRYQDWLGYAPKKPIWGVPQAFYDTGSFWQRYPTPEEEIILALLRINHGAKGIVAWIYPTESQIEEITSAFAKVVTEAGVTSFLLGRNRTVVEVEGGDGLVDVTIWVQGNEALVGIVHMGDADDRKPVKWNLPRLLRGSSGIKTLWGDETTWWTTVNGSQVYANEVKGLGTWLLKIDLA